MGVARCRVGSCGRPPAAPTALTLGDGGMANPSLGVRAPLALPPARAGLRRGAGEDIRGIGLADCIDSGVGISNEGVEAFIARKQSAL